MTGTLDSVRPTLIAVAIVTVVLVWTLRDLAVLVGYAVLLAYALLPVVRAVERLHGPRGRRPPRGMVAAGVMLALVAIVGWCVGLAIPRVGTEAAHFAANAPDVMERVFQELHRYSAEHGLGVWLDPAIEGARADVLVLVHNLGGTLAHSAVRLFSGIGQLLALALLPLLGFYLLAESDAVRVSALRFVPEEARSEVTRLGGAVDRALRSYVRGQAIVCLLTGALVGIGLALLHYPGALLLGLLAGAAELVPYLGFLVAAVAIGLSGSSVSLLHASLGLAVYIGLNWAIGSFVTPRVMGRYLKMHPFVVTVSVLAGARMLGPAGALLALPVVAALQAVIGELAPAARSGPDIAVFPVPGPERAQRAGDFGPYRGVPTRKDV